MARTVSFSSKFKQIVKDFVIKTIGGIPTPNKRGKLPVDLAKLKAFSYSGRVRAEKPTRSFQDFAFITEILANSPSIHSAVRKLAQDTALDENGDERAWSPSVNFEIDYENASEETKSLARESKRQMQIVLQEFASRTDIGYNTKHYVFKFMTAGDCFAELDISLDTKTGLGKIESIRELPTFQMSPTWDESGNLIGYQQNRFINDANPIIWTIPQQVIHWKHNAIGYFPLGQTIFSGFESRWEQFKLIEIDLLSAIHIRVTAPEIHYLGDKEAGEPISDLEKERYKAMLLENPTDINRFYVVDESQVKIEFPQNQDFQSVKVLLDAHRDFESRFIEALGVPGILAGNAKDIAGRHIANSMDQDYGRRIASLRGDFSKYLKSTLYLELALNGFDLSKPEQYGARKISIDLIWPSLEPRTNTAKRTLMDWVGGKIPLIEALRQDGYTDPEGLIEQLKDEQDHGIYPLSYKIKEFMSNNNNGGVGVSVDNNQEENQSQIK